VPTSAAELKFMLIASPLWALNIPPLVSVACSGLADEPIARAIFMFRFLVRIVAPLVSLRPPEVVVMPVTPFGLVRLAPSVTGAFDVMFTEALALPEKLIANG
jgi:hypothetical protein